MKIFGILLGSTVASSIGADCPCGLTGLSCMDLVEGLVDTANTLSNSCYGIGADECKAVDGEALCVCKCGWKGDFCEERVEPISWNFSVAIGLPAALLIAFVLYFIHREKKTKSSDWDIPSANCVTGGVSTNLSIVLVYRVVLALFGWCLLIYILIVAGNANPLKFFTIWNWALLTAYFSVGAYLSAKATFRGTSDAKRLTVLERIFWVMMEVELTSTFLVLVVFWLVLVPSIKGLDYNPVTFDSLMMHALNTLLMIIDFLLMKLPVKHAHFIYIASWASLYALFHGLLMVALYARGEDHCPSYGFLSVAEPTLLVWVCGLLVGYYLFFMLTFGFSKILTKVEDAVEDVLALKIEEMTPSQG